MILKPDLKQTIQHLESLNYNTDSSIYIRSFAGKGLKSTAYKSTVKLNSLPTKQSENCCFYVAVNGGHKDVDITECRAIFAEWDNLPLDLQEVMWEEKGFLNPTFQVKTRKSIHCYWVFSTPIPVADWRILQTDLLNYLDADRTLKNPSRVMRLAGYYHVQKDCEPLLCEIINPTGELYTYSTLRDTIPMKNETWDNYLNSFTLPCPETLSLFDLLPKKHQDNLSLGVAEGTRDNVGFALTRELIAIEKYLISINQNYTDTVQSLLGDYVTRVGLSEVDVTRWLKSASKYSDNPCLTPEMIKSKYASKTYKSTKPTKVKSVKNIKVAIPNEKNQEPETAQPKAYNPKFNYTQLAFDALYLGKDYIAIDEDLYKFETTHYVLCNKQLELKRIAKWCASHSFKLTEKAKLNNVLDWAIVNLSVGKEEVNPAGINLKNGVLTVKFDDQGHGSVDLKDHNPNTIYTYCSEINYDPKADPFHCNKLLECLEEDERKVFLRTVASAFDLPFLRTKKARNSRALILYGDGNNGKDALRSVTKIIFGHALANCSLSDFLAYQNGQKNGISSLENALINWNSENVPVGSLNIKPLTAAITGDDLRCKILFKDERDFTPKSVFLFNCNDTPNIKSNAEFIKSRWAIIPFNKTFKSDPDLNQGELQADPRYKDDPNFIKENIAPAFLNLLVNEIKTLAIDGIDYTPLDHNIEILKQKSTHLFQFCDDMGIVADANGKIYINDLWELLRNWYIDNGVLEIEKSDKGKEKSIWNDQSDKYDRNVKASNQVFQRFSELFPKITRFKETIDESKKGYFYLAGIAKIASLASPSHYERDTASPQRHHGDATGDAVSLVYQHGDASDAINPILIKNFSYEKKCDLFKLIGDELGIPEDQIEKWLVAKFKIGDRVSSLVDTDNLEEYGVGTIDSVFRKEGAFYYYVTFDKVDSSHCYGEDQLTLYQQPEVKQESLPVDQEPLEVKDITLTLDTLLFEKEMTKAELNDLVKFKFGKRYYKLDDRELKELIDHIRNMPKKSERKGKK